MDRVFIGFNLENTITITIMAALGFVLAGVVVQIMRRFSGQQRMAA